MKKYILLLFLPVSSDLQSDDGMEYKDMLSEKKIPN